MQNLFISPCYNLLNHSLFFIWKFLRSAPICNPPWPIKLPLHITHLYLKLLPIFPTSLLWQRKRCPNSIHSPEIFRMQFCANCCSEFINLCYILQLLVLALIVSRPIIGRFSKSDDVMKYCGIPVSQCFPLYIFIEHFAIPRITTRKVIMTSLNILVQVFQGRNWQYWDDLLKVRS